MAAAVNSEGSADSAAEDSGGFSAAEGAAQEEALEADSETASLDEADPAATVGAATGAVPTPRRW